jgi:dipeptidyl aminopeptidase/acylaminoacyl peptidase
MHRREMNHLRSIGLLWLLIIVFPLAALAQIEKLDSGPGFDPTPLEIPDIHKTAPRPITNMDLLTLRDLHGIQISPDGKHVAFVLGQAIYESNGYRTGLFVVGTGEDSKPISLGTAGPPRWDHINQWLAEAPQWSPDSNEIYYRLNSSGNWQVWKWKVEGGAPAQVTHAEHSVQSFQLSPDGTELAMVVKKPYTIDRQQLAEHGILYDGKLAVGEPIPILDEVLRMRGGDTDTTETWMHDLRNGNERKATGKELDVYSSWENTPSGKTFSAEEIKEQHIMGVKISPDATKIVYQRWVGNSAESDAWSFPLLLKSTSGGGSPIVLTPGIYSVAQYWWTPDSQGIYYAEFDGDGHSARLMRMAVSGGAPRQVLETKEGDYLSEYSVDHSGHLLACSRENNTTPAEVAVADLSTGQVRTLVDLNPEFQNLQLSPARRIDFFNKSDDHSWGHLVLPPSYEPGRRYPLIITTYADSDEFLRGGVGDEYPIQVFAANGFAVLDFNRGKFHNKPGDFESFVLMVKSPIEAMAVAVEKLADMGIVDSARVGITGLSHGAALVDYGISHTNLFHAAIQSGAGSFDPYGYFLGSDENRAYYLSMYGVGPPGGESAPKWQKISSSLNVQCILSPLLINAADWEYDIDIQLITTLRQSNKPVEMFIYADELHLKNQPKHRYEIYERNVDWFNFWLKDWKDLDPAKAEQYTRWEGLRKLSEKEVRSASNR